MKSDQELLISTAAARRAAHEAPLNPYRQDANGRRWVEMRSYAFADRARDWMELAREVDGRGLRQPHIHLGNPEFDERPAFWWAMTGIVFSLVYAAIDKGIGW